MAALCVEERAIHTRLLKCALEEDEARAYWACETPELTAAEAFDSYLFGAKSLPRVEVLLTNMRARFDAFPHALACLRGWAQMTPQTRRVICHWHLQLADPLYRAFTGDYLVARHHAAEPVVYRDPVISWVEQRGAGRWTMSTRVQFASKLLSCALRAGLLTSSRDPRPVAYPVVPDDALIYLLYMMREVRFEGTLLENPYLGSVGLAGEALEERLLTLEGLKFMRQGVIVDFGWRHDSLEAWAAARRET